MTKENCAILSELREVSPNLSTRDFSQMILFIYSGIPDNYRLAPTKENRLSIREGLATSVAFSS